MSTLKRKQTDRLVGDNSGLQTFKKAIKASSEWPDKDEFLDVVYWLRQIIGVLVGILWGIVPLKGFVAILLFFAVNLAIVYIYFNMFQRVNEEDFGGVSEILKEGLMTSFATFIVIWIILFSALHAD